MNALMEIELKDEGLDVGKINSRAKGARGELELAHKLTDSGYPARRGQQYEGSSDSPDVVCPSLNTFLMECKLVEALNLHKAMAKTRSECNDSQVPVVFHKKNRTGWLVSLEYDDFIALLKGHPDYQRPRPEEEYTPKCPQCDSVDVKKDTKISHVQDYWNCLNCNSYWPTLGYTG